MRTALSLELELFEQQRVEIDRALARPSEAFRAYEQRYRRRTQSSKGTPVSKADVQAAVLQADAIYVGDYHTLRESQLGYLDLVMAAATSSPRRVVMALEFVEGRHQSKLDAYLRGGLSFDRLRRTMGHGGSSAFEIWRGFEPVLRFAKAHGLELVGIDCRGNGPRSLESRDAYASARVTKALLAPDRPRVMALIGQYHVVPTHLPARVQAAARHQALVIYQNCEGVYWPLARRGRVTQVEAVRLREGELCLLNASPVLCQQSFLDYLEAEAGDAPVQSRAAAERFREMAALIARLLGVNVRNRLGEVEVATAANLHLLSKLRREGLSPREVARVRKQVLSRESYYVPRARLAYLASLSLNHAAEEAAHFVRHCLIGAAMDAPRRAEEAFYARCLEEALGFLGSRFINPGRRCRTVEDWAQTFAQARGEERQIAAFVLAHKGAEARGATEARKILPLRRDRLFNAVSHALGYLLGDALHRAVSHSVLERPRLRLLFRDPFLDPVARYFEMVREFPH